MTVNIALLGFGTVAIGIPFLLKENGKKIVESAGSNLVISKVLVRSQKEVDKLNQEGYIYHL